jgi:uncharacterized protein (DUF58 family)
VSAVERAKRLGKPALLISLGLILYLIAASSGAGWLYVISAGIAGTVVVSALLPPYNVRGLKVSRRAPLVGRAGEPLACALEVHNRGLLARHLLEMRDDFAGDTGRALVARVRPGAPEVFEYAVENPRRGVYSGGEVTVESAAPFGLFYARRRMRAASSTVVYPRVFDVARLPRPVSEDAAETEKDEAASPHRGLGGEFWGVREYRPGDPARLIAWRQSARSLASGRLSVVELARETDPPLSVALNLDPRAPAQAREMIVSAAASLMLRALREGREIVADAGAQRLPFPEIPDADGVLTWCAGLGASRPPKMESASVEILPSLENTRPKEESGTVVLVSCHDFAGPGAWMTPEEERRLTEGVEADGRRAVSLGPDVHEPWRVA